MLKKIFVLWYQTNSPGESLAHLGFFILCCRFLMLKRQEEEQQKVDVLHSTSISRKYWSQILC